ncbi:MAG: hypothetical protein ACXVJO_17120, partial [Thermoanaerobaculia bacterium]
GEYKNPTYVYLLAGVFRFVAPSDLATRRASAILGFAAALLLGLLARRMSGRDSIAVITFLTALFTPALFEISRLAFEVCCYPLVLALFLLSAFEASRRERWSPALVAALVASLTLLTYTYSIGRLLAPMLLAGLLLLLTRRRLAGWLATATLYAFVGILPLFIFQWRHPGALTGHFRDMTYLNNATIAGAAAGFEQHFVDNLLPLGMALEGDPNPRHHVPSSGGSILLMSFALAALAIALAILERDRWLLFLGYGTLASIVPAALTIDRYHTLRMVAYPVFLIVLSIAALQRVRSKPFVALLLTIGLVQASYFLVQFHRHGKERLNDFEFGSRQVVDALLDLNERPVYISPGPIYALAYWYAAQRGVSAGAFHVLSPHESAPPGSLLFTSEGCERCPLIVQLGSYRGFRMAAPNE